MFISFTTNNNYCKIAEVMIKSIHEFSKKKIILYCVNFDKPKYSHKYDNLICKRINWDKSYSIYFLKPKIILDAIINMGVKEGIYVEADDIVTKNIDTLFEECKRISYYPLCPIHPKDPNNQKRIMKYMNVTSKSMPYVHAHVVFTDKTQAFIQEWLDTLLEIKNIYANWDETVLNVLFWKHKINDYINYIYDPYFKGIYNNKFNMDKRYMFHGCKKLSESLHILNLLKKLST